MDRLGELWQLVREIPEGETRTYGELGRDLHQPTSGRIVGRWMASAPPDVPWWRVVAKSGLLVTTKRDPHLAKVQAELLQKEGVRVEAGKVI